MPTTMKKYANGRLVKLALSEPISEDDKSEFSENLTNCFLVNGYEILEQHETPRNGRFVILARRFPNAHHP